MRSFLHSFTSLAQARILQIKDTKQTSRINWPKSLTTTRLTRNEISKSAHALSFARLTEKGGLLLFWFGREIETLPHSVNSCGAPSSRNELGGWEDEGDKWDISFWESRACESACVVLRVLGASIIEILRFNFCTIYFIWSYFWRDLFASLVCLSSEKLTSRDSKQTESQLSKISLHRNSFHSR